MANDKKIKVDIVTPQRVVYSEYAVSVSVPGSDRPFEVLYNHAPITSSLISGAIKINIDGNTEIWYATGSGFIEVLANVVSIVVETAISSDELTQEIIDTEQKAAQDLLAKATNIYERNDAKKVILEVASKLRVLRKK